MTIVDGDRMSRIMDGSSWSDFVETVRRAGDVIGGASAPLDAFDRAEGYRYLTRLVRVALETHIETADPRFPVFRRPAHETVKIGADNPDNHYQSATLDGAFEYRIRGLRNSIHYLGLGTYRGNYGSAEPIAQTGYLEAADLEIALDGRFEIVLSAAPQPGNWLPMEVETSSIIVRQTFLDRAHERIADLHIERLGGEAAPTPITAEAMDRGLAAAGAYVRGTAEFFARWSASFAERPNELPELDPAIAGAALGDPNIRYYHGYWEIAAHEALLVELHPPECDYWNLQLNNYWMESLDYRHHTIAVNHHQAAYRDDGSVAIAIAHRNPGAANWLDTAGHNRGTLCLRWIGAAEHPAPSTQVVPWADVEQLFRGRV